MDFGSCLHWFLGALWLVFTIFAVIHILSSRASVGAKAVWIVLILIFPYGGPILWFFFGPRDRR